MHRFRPYVGAGSVLRAVYAEAGISDAVQQRNYRHFTPGRPAKPEISGAVHQPHYGYFGAGSVPGAGGCELELSGNQRCHTAAGAEEFKEPLDEQQVHIPGKSGAAAADLPGGKAGFPHRSLHRLWLAGFAQLLRPAGSAGDALSENAISEAPRLSQGASRIPYILPDIPPDTGRCPAWSGTPRCPHSGSATARR